MLRRVILILSLSAIAAALLALGAAGAFAKDPIQCKSGKVCQGTRGNDTIYGTPGDDDISPGFGDDIVYADGPRTSDGSPVTVGGDDQVRHSGGNDYIEGGPGSDVLRGGFGLDTIFGNAKTTTTDPISGQVQVIDVADGAHDLVDCAYIKSRGDPKPDLGYGEQPDDTVVDCSNMDEQ
jgi:Ca2+-binding RTX toxin-like protein